MQQKEGPLLEQSGYGQLYQRYASVLFAYAFQQTGSREDAEDIVLDVFLSVLQNPRFATFDEQKQLAWLWTITRNKLVDRHRYAARRQHVSIEWLSEPFFEDDSLTPEEISLKREEYARLHSVLQTLPEFQQEVLRLRFGHGLQCNEIAPVLEKSEGSIRMILFRALHRLRKIYISQEKGGKA